LLTSSWRSLASSSSRARRALEAAGVATTALPDSFAVCVGASTARTASSVNCLVTGASAPAPGACSSAASAALGEGAQAPTSQEGLPPVAFFLLSLSRRRVLRGRRGRAPAARVAGIPRPAVPGTPAAGSFAPSCVSPALAPAAAPRARSGSGRGRVGPRGVHGHPLLGRAKCQNRSDASRRHKGKGGAYSPAGRQEALQMTRGRRCHA
jgi:hypothetical protein